MTYKEMLDVVKTGAESKSAGITKKVEFIVKPDTKNPGGITIAWITEYDGNKYGDYIRENGPDNLYEAGSLLAEQCLGLFEALGEAKR